eukprot:m.4844 g.4844  ORF g.4844 m.4844 type:complete len:487 (-) comp2300_c0_seq1:216-1676(-)
MSKYAELQKDLNENGQGHVLKYWDELSDEEKEAFAEQLSGHDFADITNQLKRAEESSTSEKVDAFMKPIPEENIGFATEFPPTEDMERWTNLGFDAIAAGSVAALLLAGGQGTRLGSANPKGMFPLGLASEKTLFQLQAERIIRLQNIVKKRTGNDVIIPWYIMVSGPTYEKTKEFLTENGFFGVNAEDVMIFKQFEIPSITTDGKMILNGKGSIAKNPDGNGGIYMALLKRGVLADMEKRGIKHVHAYCVDNVLVKVANPCYIGFCIEKQVPVGALVVQKEEPHEKVGVVCLVNGKYRVVEYSEISTETAEKTKANGKLMYAEGNICNHYFSKAFLDTCGERNGELVHHIAHKKIPYLNEEGELINPDSNSGIKLEKFIFDVFQFAPSLGVLCVSREHAFSPLKNASGASSSTKETCQSDLYALHRLYLESAGMRFVNNEGQLIPHESQNETHVCEISPLVSYGGEDLDAIVKAHPTQTFPAIFN